MRQIYPVQGPGWPVTPKPTDGPVPDAVAGLARLYASPVEVLLLPELEPPPQAAREAMSMSATATKANPDAKRRIPGKEEKNRIV